VDERGQPFKVRIVGAVANSILQGSLIIDEAEFVKRFPSEAGYRMWLIDAPIDKVTEVSATLSRAVGFRARMLRWLVLSEHGALLWLGLGVGVIAAALAVLPALLSPGAAI